MAVMDVEVVSAERELFSGEAAEVYARSVEGEIGILPGHQPALLSLDIAPVRIKLEDGSWETFAVHEGVLFFQDDRLVVLADQAERADDIDRQRAQQQLDDARSLSPEDDAGEEQQRRAIKRAELRLEVADQ